VKRAFRGKLLTPCTPGPRGDPGSPPLRYLADGMLVVDDEGALAYVGPFEGPDGGRDPAWSGPVLDLRPRVLVPGFVDTHVHYPQTRIIGSATGPLLRWLEATVFPEEARFHDEAYAQAVAREFTSRLIAAGTTTASIFSSSSLRATEVMFEELERSGLRAIAGLTLMDQGCLEALHVAREPALEACERLIARWHGAHGGRLSFAITPRFALSCSRALMEGAAKLAADRRLLVQTHISENPREGEETLRAHPYADDYLGVYEATGLIGPRTLLAHAVHLSPHEWDRVASRGARIAHCPDSNFFLGSGRMPLREPRSRGVPVGLGSDVAGGRTFDMRRAMASAYDNALCLGDPATPEELFTMATLGGARALGLDAVTGSLEIGKDADFIAIDLPEYLESQAAVLGHIAFASESRRVSRVFVQGELVGGATEHGGPPSLPRP
jgi:guanine deaminase